MEKRKEKKKPMTTSPWLRGATQGTFIVGGNNLAMMRTLSNKNDGTVENGTLTTNRNRLQQEKVKG